MSSFEMKYAANRSYLLMRAGFILGALFVVSFQSSDVRAGETSNTGESANTVGQSVLGSKGGDKPFVGPEERPLAPLTAADLETLTAESREHEGRKMPAKIWGVSTGFHAGGTLIFLVAWGVKALTELDSSWGTHEGSGSSGGFKHDVYLYGMIGLPILSGLSVLGVSWVATYMGNRAFWTQTKFVPILIGGLIAWTLNTGLMTLLGYVCLGPAFVVAPTIGAAFLPPLGEVLGYLVSRRRRTVGPMRVKEPEARHQQSRLEPEWIPPMLTAMPAPGRSAPMPGLHLVGLRF